MGRKKKPPINPSIEAEYNRLMRHYQTLALNRFKWENLPNGIESRYIEQMLYDNGECAFFIHPDLGYCVLRSNPRFFAFAPTLFCFAFFNFFFLKIFIFLSFVKLNFLLFV